MVVKIGEHGQWLKQSQVEQTGASVPFSIASSDGAAKIEASWLQIWTGIWGISSTRATVPPKLMV